MTAADPKTAAHGRARLYKLKATPGGRAGEGGKREVDGPPIEVQFNPATLRLQRTGSLDVGGKTAGTQVRQHTGVGTATLSFDLEFDTTEDGDSTTAVDVRTKTQPIRQFVEPARTGARSTSPPAALFEFGTFRFPGVVTSLSEEIDYFLPPDSTPARARLSISMRGVDDRVEGAQQGPGGRTAQDATEPGRAPDAQAGPGGGPTAHPERQETARNGESAAQLAARLGGNPAAWRSVMAGQSNPLSLPPGSTIQVGPELTAATTAVGQAAGFASEAAAGDVARLEAALGLPPAPSAVRGVRTVGDVAAAGRDARRAAGFAFAAAGGIAAAQARVTAEQVGRATAAAREAFETPPVSAATRSAVAAAADPRAVGYGRSVPLRAAPNPEARSAISAGGSVSLSARVRPTELPGTDRITAPWVQPPAAAPNGPGR